MLNAKAHAAPLFEALHGPRNAALWRYLREDPAETVAALLRRLTDWTALPHVRAHVFLSATGEMLGMGARLHRQFHDHPVLPPGPYVELAAIVFRLCDHGTGLPQLGVAQLVSLALSDRGVNGCLWRCATDNIASDRFARKLGFRHYATAPDGIAKGMARNSHFYVLERPGSIPACYPPGT